MSRLASCGVASMACCPGKRTVREEETREEPYSRGSVRGEARRRLSIQPAAGPGRREGMFPGLYSEIFGRSERLGCILNFDHSFDAIEAYL